ncbi:hypothetical protein HPP92_011331 [Vanilla planifolia]|nr:hypothetical protein HPP92_011331 [Vanilla planifolia]
MQVFRKEPKEYDGRSDLSEENKEVKSEHYWGSEESMAGEESAGEGSIAHSGMIYAPGEKASTAVPEMKKAEINQRKQGLAFGGGAQEGNNASKVKTRVGAFEALFSLEESRTSVGEQAAGFSTKTGDAIKYLINNREGETYGREEKQGDNESSERDTTLGKDELENK